MFLYYPKDLRMNPKRRHFTLQKAVFRALKGRLLQAKRRHIGKALTVNELQSGDDVC